jgi:trehalose synthase-fused probable maltokinase
VGRRSVEEEKHLPVDVESLRSEIAEQRWFGGKDRPISGVVVLDEAVVEDGPPALVLAIVRVNFTDGASHMYHVPLLVDERETRDAFSDIGRLRIVGELMAHGHAVKGTSGTFFFGGAGLDPLAPPGGASIRQVEAEQSNTSAILDDDIIVKFFRRIEPGINPELELNRLLTNEGFPHIPAQVGEISYAGDIEDSGTETEIDLGIAQTYVPGAIDGWVDVLGHVHRLYDQIGDDDGPGDRRTRTEERAAVVLERLELLGDVTASLHICLSREEIEPDFVPEPTTASDLTRWAGGAAEMLGDLLDDGTPGLSELAPGSDRIIRRFSSLEGDLGYKTRIHGDYHLGQVLHGRRDWLIIDFEGEPARPIPIRRTKQPALRDVAGMLRSFSYAALVPMLERTEEGSEDRARIEPWAEIWEELTRERFLNGYTRKSHEGRFLPTDRDRVTVMLDFFELEKALYELGYERGHRPHWAIIPLRGIRSLVERMRPR